MRSFRVFQKLRLNGDHVFAVITVATSLFAVLYYYASIWVLHPDGLSTIAPGTPYWDFSNLWAGSRMALDGHISSLFDVEVYRQTLRGMFSPALPNQEWSYPPSLLLIGTPLAVLPIFPAYGLWTLGTITLLYLSLRRLELPPYARLAVALSPAVFINAAFGQNGALTSALLFGGLLVLPKRPILAGVLIGVLTIKPHLGILLPVCLLAAGAYGAIASATLTAVAMVFLTGVFFGFEVWPLFFEKTMPLMSVIMEAPYPQPYHANALTVFVFARSLGLEPGASYLVQGLVSVAAAAAAAWLWRPALNVDHGARVCITGLLVMIATPYGYTYDSIPMTIAVMYFFIRERTVPNTLFAVIWIFPLLAHLLNKNDIGAGVTIPVGFAIVALVHVWRRSGSRAYAGRPFRSGDRHPSAE